MNGADASWTAPERERMVVRKVGNRAGGIAHAEAERATALVRDVPGEHRETLEFVLTFLDRAESPALAERARLDREVRRGERAGEYALGVGTLAWHHDVHLVARPSARGEERQAVGVVPVQVTQHDRAVERRV